MPRGRFRDNCGWAGLLGGGAAWVEGRGGPRRQSCSNQTNAGERTMLENPVARMRKARRPATAVMIVTFLFLRVWRGGWPCDCHPHLRMYGRSSRRGADTWGRGRGGVGGRVSTRCHIASGGATPALGGMQCHSTWAAGPEEGDDRLLGSAAAISVPGEIAWRGFLAPAVRLVIKLRPGELK